MSSHPPCMGNILFKWFFFNFYFTHILTTLCIKYFVHTKNSNAKVYNIFTHCFIFISHVADLYLQRKLNHRRLSFLKIFLVSYMYIVKTLKIFSSETLGPILIKLHRDVPWMVLYHYCSKNSIPWRTLVAMATERKNFKNLLKINRKA